MAKQIITLGDVDLEMRSYDSGSCIHFGKARCMVFDKSMREQQKSLPKKERCKGDDTKCSYFCGSSPLVPPYDEEYLLPEDLISIVCNFLKYGDNCLMFGPPGTGKTSLINQLASLCNWGVESFDCSEETTADKIIGQWVVIGTEMQFIDGHVTSAMRNGFVLLENEADFMRPELRGEVHGIMDKGGQITLHAIHPKTKKIFREKLYRHPNFRWVSTANTTGYGDDLFAFHGTQYMNAASRDRYETIIKVDFKKEEEEVLILKKKTGIDEDTAEKMVRIANDCRQSQNSMIFQFTLRRLLAWAKYWQLSGEVPATDMCVLNYCNITDRHTVASLVRTHLALDVS